MRSNLLFIGPYEKKPKGGVAFVLSEYKKIFPEAFFLSTSTSNDNKILKFFVVFKALISFIFLLGLKRNIKVIHIHVSSYSSFKRKYVFFNIAKIFNKKIVCHIHGGSFHIFYEESSLKLKKNIQHFIEKADCIICLSQKWKEYFEKEFNINKVVVVPNIISQPKLSTKVIQNNIKTTFLFLGLIDSNKGVWLLLEILKDYKQYLLGKAVFKIGGNGKIDKLQRLIKDYGLLELVEFEGWVSGNIKQELLNNADVYLLPSYNEGLPISILEAMSYGLPIISTKVGGIPEIVDSKNGVLIEPGNKQELRDAIFLAINEPKDFKSKGKESLNRVANYLPESVKCELQNLYKSILK